MKLILLVVAILGSFWLGSLTPKITTKQIIITHSKPDIQPRCASWKKAQEIEAVAFPNNRTEVLYACKHYKFYLIINYNQEDNYERGGI